MSRVADMGLMYASTEDFQVNTLWGWAGSALLTTGAGAGEDWMQEWVAPEAAANSCMWLMKGGRTISAIGAITVPVFNQKGFYDYFGDLLLLISKLGRL